MDPVYILVASAGLVLALSILILMIRPDARSKPSNDRVRVYCASGVAAPMNELVSIYNRKYGSQVEVIRTGGSGQLAGQIKTEHELGLNGADVYISADEDLIQVAIAEGLISKAKSIAWQRPVIAVHGNSELKLNSLSDVLSGAQSDALPDLVSNGEIRFGIAAKQSAIGRLTRELAQQEQLLDRLELQKATDSENVMTLAQALVTRSLDAAIVWDTVVYQVNNANQSNDANQSNQVDRSKSASESGDSTTTNRSSESFPKIKIAAVLDDSEQFVSPIIAGVLKKAEAETQAQKEASNFVDFLAKSQVSKRTFERFRFSVSGSIPKASVAH